MPPSPHRILMTLPLLWALLAGCTLPTQRGLLYRPAAAAGLQEEAGFAPAGDLAQVTARPTAAEPAQPAGLPPAGDPPGPTPDPDLHAATPGPEPHPASTLAPAAATAEAGPVQAASPSPGAHILSAAAPVEDPLRFVFPTRAAAPASAWRPPLYPTPWALTPFDHFFFARPVAADEINWPLADYRYGGTFFENVVHTGIDIPARTGTLVLAAGPGRVTWAGRGLYYLDEDRDGPYGLAVVVKHDFGYQGQTLFTVYGHLDRVNVDRGQEVRTGDLLGLSGETGSTTGPHLHFEVRVGKNNFFGSRNPELWLSPPQGWGVLAARVMTTAGELAAGQEVIVRTKDGGRKWTVRAYGDGSVNSDPFYRENLVLGDLPAGDYVVWIPYAGSIYDLEVSIRPGMVTYFTFEGKRGYKRELPAAPGAGFVPPEAAPSGR